MKTLLALTTVLALTGTAFAEFSIRNDDDSSYELTKKCGDKSEDWSIAGKVTKTNSPSATRGRATSSSSSLIVDTVPFASATLPAKRVSGEYGLRRTRGQGDDAAGI